MTNSAPTAYAFELNGVFDHSIVIAVNTAIADLAIGPTAASSRESAGEPASDGIGVEGLSKSETAPMVKPPCRADALAPRRAENGQAGLIALICLALITPFGWRLANEPGQCRLANIGKVELAAEKVAKRIIIVESGGDRNARNSLSSATGAGQFLDGTWLDMIRAYRPDLAERSESEILNLRHDPELSREMVAKFAEQNAALLASHCQPVTPGTLYLSHFAGPAGAAAVLSAPAYADAAATMAKADSTGRATREQIVKANPFLQTFTVTDLKNWADRKMSARKETRLSGI